MTHTLWGELVRAQTPDPLVLDQQIHYAKGYILALEDVLGDMDQVYVPSNIRIQVEKTLQSARKTLAILTDLANETVPFTLAELESGGKRKGEQVDRE